MSNDLEAIKRVVDAFERSDWAEIDVRTGGVRVHLVAGDGPPAGSAGSARPPTTGVDHAAPPVASVAQVEVPVGAHVVVSPSPGIFWRAPDPSAPPFVEVGAAIDATTTVGIVEVMKLMNHVKAGVAGEVVAVHAANGVAVAAGDPLVSIVAAESTA